MNPTQSTHADKIGLKPGALFYLGEERNHEIVITTLEYDKTEIRERKITNFSELGDIEADSKRIYWIDVNGVYDTALIESIGAQFKIGALVLEDILNTNIRPKFEDWDELLFCSLKMLYWRQSGLELQHEQISLVVGKNWLITFQEIPGDVLEKVRKRLQKTVPRDRFLNTSYLAYSIIDATVDHYFLIADRLTERFDEIENHALRSAESLNPEDLYELRRTLIEVRRLALPVREIANGLLRSEHKLIKPGLTPYLRDLYEHVVYIGEELDTLKDTLNGIMELRIASVGNRMNEVMKVLTVIATIFIPLSFLAGVYGMNFDTSASPFNLPELGFKYGYVGFWMIAVAIGAGMWVFFKRKNWV